MKNCMIIVNYNDFKNTKHLIDNINSYNIIDKIIIVDNHSKKDDVNKLHELKDKRIHIILNEANLGYGGAINRALEYLKDEYKDCNLIISNSDVIIFSENDIKEMLNYLKKPDVGLVGPSILERGTINRGEKIPRPIYDLFKNNKLIKKFITLDKYYYSDAYYDQEYSCVDSISTAFFAIKLSTLKNINYMDENIILYYEEYILGKKITSMNLKVIVLNNVKTKHLFSKSVDNNKDTIKKEKVFADSQLYFHSVYNNCNKFELLLLKLNKRLQKIKAKIKRT